MYKCLGFFNLSINILDLIFFILHLFDNKSEFTVLYLFHSSWNEQKRLRFYLFSLKHTDIYPRLRQIFHQQNNNYRTDKSLLALCKQSRSHSIRCNQRWSPDRKRKQKSISTSKGRFHVNCYLQGTKVASFSSTICMVRKFAMQLMNFIEPLVKKIIYIRL